MFTAGRRVRENFSAILKLPVIANLRMAENSSRIKFDERFFSSQQPLRFAALSASRCGSSEILLLLPRNAAMQNFVLKPAIRFSIAIRGSDSNIRNIVAALAAASCCSLFLHFSGKPASATGSGLPLHTGLSFTTARSAAASPCLPPTRGRHARAETALCTINLFLS